MENEKNAALKSFLEVVPSVEFCCLYGSVLHPNNRDKSAMLDFIFGVSDPQQWHSEVSQVADKIGVGVHFNPFITWNDKVHVLVDNVDIGNANSANLRAALSAALLLLPSKFTEEDLYSKICSLSYMGDLRMLFAEDKNKDCGLSVTRSLLHALPPLVRSKMRAKLGEKKMLSDSGKVSLEVRIHSREEAARCLQRVVRHTVMVSSVRQAVSGLLAAGGINATRYLASKVCKAWRSWT